jgi:hypothetical protein
MQNTDEAGVAAMRSKGVYQDCVPKAQSSFEELKSIGTMSILGSSLDAAQMSRAKPDPKHWHAGTEATAGERSSTQATPDQIGRETTMAKAFDDICQKLWNFCDKDPLVGKDPRWLNLKKGWPRALLFCEQGPAYKWTGMYLFNGDFSIISFNITSSLDYTKDIGGWNALLLHELAHSTSTTHNSEWRSAWMFLARIATDRLGIPVNLMCWQCEMYGACDKALCPTCTWPDLPASGCCTSDPNKMWTFKEKYANYGAVNAPHRGRRHNRP